MQRILEEYAHIASLDIREAFEPDASLKPIDEWPDSIARAVAGIEVMEMGDEGGRFRLHKIKLCSKLHALDSIAKHLGMFVDRSQFEMTGKVEIDVATARQRFLDRVAGTAERIGTSGHLIGPD